MGFKGKNIKLGIQFHRKVNKFFISTSVNGIILIQSKIENINGNIYLRFLIEFERHFGYTSTEK
jgi:hypothetical protein